MLRRYFLPILASLSPFVLQAQEPVQFTVSDDVSSCLNVRARPESSAPAFICLERGTQVEVVGVAPYWRQILLEDGRTGWAAKKFLQIAAASVMEPAPATADTVLDNAWLEVHVVDVGQGDGIWIHTYDDNIPGNGRYEGYNIVVDGGPRDTRYPMLRYLMDKAHTRAVIDALIITHPHVDHYPAAWGILDSFEVKEFYDSGYPKKGPTWKNFLARVARETHGGQPIVQRIGRDSFGTPDWGSELKVRFLYAYTGRNEGFGSEDQTWENNASIVFRIDYGTQSILFMGDAEGKKRSSSAAAAQYAERFLLDSLESGALNATVLKVAHHGSETSSSLPFIAAVNTRHVVVSSGRKKYGPRFLPDQSTLRRYCDHNDSTRIYRTDQDDATERRTEKTDADGDHIIITMNGKDTDIEAYSAGNPITPTACVP